jgi:hypothetical protein
MGLWREWDGRGEGEMEVLCRKKSLLWIGKI